MVFWYAPGLSVKAKARAGLLIIMSSNSYFLLALDSVQLGFLPRDVAKWVAPLSDIGLFAFSAYIHPKEVLTAALEGSNNKVKLILNVYTVWFRNPNCTDLLLFSINA